MAKFIDENCPGTIYEGEEVHFNGLIDEGGAPAWISDRVALKLMQEGIPNSVEAYPWSYQSAPSFWGDNNGRPN